ncbi:serine hydrolase [Bacillus sp. NTK074B]|uniref:serine hydrolase n=1 Tax=Bacillus sp. NTK074B TaxID=2802174 RepID=UPI001A90928C|nr:serine hydrolase [Bacillus sp. NTK074B]
MKLKETQALQSIITSLIPSHTLFGFYLHDTNTKETITINEDERLPLASVSKWITSILVSRSTHSVVNEDLYLTVCEHSTGSYVNLIHELPEQYLNDSLASLDVDCKVSDQNRDTVNNIGTPKGLFQMMDLLLGKGLKPDHKEAIMKGMKHQSDPDGFCFSLPWFHMTGGLEGVCNDVGFIKTDETVVIVIGLLHCQDPLVEWNELEKLMSTIGESVERYIKKVYSIK